MGCARHSFRGPGWTHAERGQSLVEMTLGFVFLTMLVLGILDLGRLYFTYLSLQDAAGEAALYLSINPDCPEPTEDECADPKNARYRAEHSAGRAIVDWSYANFIYESEGGIVTVEIKYDFRVLTPVISAITGNTPIKLGVIASNNVINLGAP